MPTTTTLPDPAIQRPHARRTGGRRTVFIAALLIIGTALGVIAWYGSVGPETSQPTTIRPTQQVDRIEVDIDAGDIEVESGDKVVVDVESQGRAGGASVTTSDLSDGVLSVFVSCPRLALLRSCNTSVSLVVPPGTPLIAATEAGTITASDLTAGADLRTAAGAIDVRDLAGTIRLQSEAGSLSGTVLRGTLDASTAAGPISITVAEDLTRLTAATETGPVELVVPDAAYRVDAGTSLGRTDIDVTTTTDASRVIEAHSKVGDVTVRTGTHRTTVD